MFIQHTFISIPYLHNVDLKNPNARPFAQTLYRLPTNISLRIFKVLKRV